MPKIAKTLMILLGVIILSGTVQAQLIENYTIKINIIGTTALVSQNIQMNSIGEIKIELPKDAQITDISNKNYSFNNGILSTKSKDNLRIKYLTKEIIEKTDKDYILSNIKFPLDTKIFSLKIILPESAVLDSPHSIYPSSKITSDGINIILNWKRVNIKKGESIPFFVIFKEPSPSKSTLWIILILIILGGIFLSIRNLIKKERKKTSKKTKKKQKITQFHLLESESLIINALKKLGGEAWQKQLQIQTGFSKAKLSRTLRNLELRKLIKKIPLGNTNKIKIIK